MRATRSRANTKPLSVLEQIPSSSESDLSSVHTSLAKLICPKRPVSSTKSNSPPVYIPERKALPAPPQTQKPKTASQESHQHQSQQEQKSTSLTSELPQQSPKRPQTHADSTRKQSPIDYNQKQKQLTILGDQLSSKLHQLSTIYKTKATKYKAITTYQLLESEKRKIINTTSTMLKSETNHDTIQRIISDSNALLFPMSLKQHYLKLHISQIANQEKELEVIRAELADLHQQFVTIEASMIDGTFAK
ncbi:hypothetical protein I9W82_001928 [Candida metapsilosis]|uniref:Uncharacterized protein n=1 Tax=Candida metapsilosis TaxID=273372 RepID=A0A8H7ZIX1_9ASCO|nr:hypothetical protein I9W82_001928 [Candida metapsilosis]